LVHRTSHEPNGGTNACCSEQERDLVVVPMDAPNPARRAEGASRGGALSLPFFDDFSTPSMPGVGFEGFEAYQRWEEGSARITTTYSLNAPTIGCATLDGLDRTGYPYNFVEVNTPDWADTLTSLPIALNGYFPQSNIHLMFYVQGGGRGNAPEPGQDELVLEFKSQDDVTGEVIWTEVWSTDSVSTDAFERVFVPVDEFQWLDNAFQFRFRNWGALAGNVDLWHLDYILLDDQIDPLTFEVQSEVAIVEPCQHFFASVHTHAMEPLHAQSCLLHAGQLGDGTTEFEPISGGQHRKRVFHCIQRRGSDLSKSFPKHQRPARGSVHYAHLPGQQSPRRGLRFRYGVSDTTAVFDVAVWQSSIGLLHTEKVGVPDNDSITFQQVFDIDFAYDDGTAEKAYALTAAGGKLAMRYALEVPDTLLGLAIHFTPYYNNADDETFLLRAWADSSGLPGEELGENYQFHTPEYFTDGFDIFAYYSYDDPIAVEGTIHVGLVQGSEAMLNFGLDKNTNANAGQLHYQLGVGGAWLNSDIQGTVMIRPVLRAGMADSWVTVNEGQEPGAFQVFPNPVTQGELNIQVVSAANWTLYDATGRVAQQGAWTQPGLHTINLTAAPRGTYILADEMGRRARILVQ
jgi:hypothetical protein